jgi:CRP-like cAMP-binding protein
MHLTPEDHRNLAEIEEYKKVNWYSEVVKLKAGASFGELALLNREARSATV